MSESAFNGAANTDPEEVLEGVLSSMLGDAKGPKKLEWTYDSIGEKYTTRYRGVEFSIEKNLMIEFYQYRLDCRSHGLTLSSGHNPLRKYRMAKLYRHAERQIQQGIDQAKAAERHTAAERLRRALSDDNGL